MSAGGRILVVTHKPYAMPSDPVYLPIQVGGGPDMGIARDDTGEHIAGRNAHYCELTALYWAWRNMPDAAFLGLAHYRRHFWGKGGPATGEEIARWLAADDILLARKRHYWIETTYKHYAHAHHAADLDTARTVIAERHPDYVAAFDRVMRRTSGHRFNMLIMKRPQLDAYCAWLFDILFAVEARLDISSYSAYDARVFGFLGERLLDVWLDGAGQAWRDIPYRFTEKQNWPKKIAAFIRRKLTGGGR